MKKSMGTHSVVPVVRATERTSFGYAAIFVRGGSMASVLESLQQEPSTSSSTNALIVAATNEPGCDYHDHPAGHMAHITAWT